ncbi:unnamed protein product [Litomosoides sigmodontis]|uniref:Uncharacterized protein n=1 Tax=Litomosoides sigmodontis TaxID=42156 RepID=A0A3P6V167_LITSI|nr:unnamed protein product [Litomosoides sigmodontis]
MELRGSGAGVFTSALHSDKLLCLVILVVLLVLSFLAVGIAFGIILATVNGKTPTSLKQILKDTTALFGITMLVVNEEAEILSRLGALTSNLESRHKDLRNERISFGRVFQNFTTDESCTSADEGSDSDVIYRKGISTSVQSITIPNIIVNIHASSSLFVAFTLCITAFGFLIACSTVSRLFTWINPILLLLFSLFGAVMVTVLLGSSKTTLTAYLYSFMSGCFHGTIFRGGLIILCGSDFGMRALFAMHAFFAAGILLMSLLSTLILSGVAVPHSNSSKLPYNDNMSNHLFINTKQEMDLSTQSGDDGFIRSSPLEESITSKFLRPDHVVGVESATEPKTEENVQKRKEAVGRMKSKEESFVTNGTLHANGVGKHGQSQDKFSHSNTSFPYINVSTASLFPHLRKGDNGTITNINQTETKDISNSGSTPHYSMMKPNGIASFVFSDLSCSFSGLNWNIDTATRNNFWILEDLEQKFGPFQNVHVVYAISTFLVLCHLLLCLVAVACDGSYITASILQVVELQAAPNVFTDWKKITVSWRAYSVLFFLLTGGVEFVVGESLTFYALFRPELSRSQRNGLFLSSSFWLGIVTARVLFILMTKFININRLSNFVFFCAAVAGYVAASARSFSVMLCTIFVLGLSLGSLSPFLFCWLDEQHLSSRMSLSLLYAVVICVSLSFAYIILIMTVRTAKATARHNAINCCSNGLSPEVSVRTSGQDKIHNGDYMVLMDKSDGRSDVSADSDFAEDISLN